MREDQIQTIAAINSGSSSLKFGLFTLEDPLQMIVKGKISGIGSPACLFSITNPGKSGTSCNPGHLESIEKAAELVTQWLQQQARHYKINGIGHRVVHGGLTFYEPRQIDDSLISDLQKLEPLAPLHLPDSLSIINVFRRSFAAITQVACFDTAFHTSMPFEARHYALPRYLWSEGVIRYGFHGISCEYICQQLIQWDITLSGKKIIVAHLGSGSSMTAIKDSSSIDNTMGFTPAGGLVMNTRAGDIDPGVASYLLKKKQMDAAQLDDLFNKESGFRAISGSDHPLEQLLQEEKDDPQAAQAIAMYCYHAKKQIGALAAAMGGLDILVFTGGIGEHAAVARKRICDGLAFAGIELNDELNDRSAETISELASRVQVYVIPTDEEIVIARHVKEYLHRYQ